MGNFLPLLFSLSAVFAAEWGEYDPANDTTTLNPKPLSFDHLRILPPAMQQEMTRVASPMVAKSNRGTSREGRAVPLVVKDRNGYDNARKRKAERDNGAR